MTRLGMVIDLSRCYGCRACMVACKVENNTSEGHFWMYVFRMEDGEYPDAQLNFLPRPCMHCDNAPCVKVCPVQARYKRADGLVLEDWERCIGCRYCAVACPYGVNSFNWNDPKKHQYLDWKDPDPVDGQWDSAAAASLSNITNGAVPPYRNPDLEKAMKDGRKSAGGGQHKNVMEKCSFCVHRIEKGLKPACVVTCPSFSLHFGDLDDPESEVSRLLAENRSFRLKEDSNTKPKVYYIGQASPGQDVREVEAVKAKE